MRFAKPVATGGPRSCGRRRAKDLLRYAEMMMRRGREEKAKGRLTQALKFFRLAQRHQEAWVESTSELPAKGPVDPLEVADVRRRLAEELGPSTALDEPAWRASDESRFLREYAYYYCRRGTKRRSPTRRKKSAERRPWRAPSRMAAIPATPPSRRRLRVSDLVVGDARSDLLDEIREPRPAEGAQQQQHRQKEDVATTAEMKSLLAEKDLQISMLTRQLEAAGCAAISEVVPLEEAKARLQRAVESMMGEATMSEAEAEAEIDKWERFIDNHPEQISAQKRAHEAWIESNEPACREALAHQLTFVPEDVISHGTSKESLRRRGLADAVATRVFDTPAIWLLRAPPAYISRLHDADLRGKFAFQGLDALELRALWAHVRDVVFENDASKKKAAWRDGLLARLKDYAKKDLPPAKRRHPAYEDDAKGPFDPNAPVVPVKTASNDRRDDDDAETTVVGGGDDDDDDASYQSNATPSRRSSVVSLAKEQLRKNSGFRDDAPVTPRGVSPARRALVERRRTAVSPRPSAANLMAELKSSLRKRCDAGPESPPQTPESSTRSFSSSGAASPPMAATPTTKPALFAGELQRLAAARAARAAAAAA